jgi:Zn-dependent M16 (insulinase) family peptidase
MNKKTKLLIAITLSTMLISQALIMQTPNSVKAAGVSVQASYTALESNSLGGFKLESKKWIEDLKCNSYTYVHSKSGAHLIYLESNSDDKMMCVNFRTPTKDNTGVNHVIEHSVLCGSKNYPVKDLFNQMGKQSMSTFLNAMTSNDSTIYPVSSKNDKDFQNLMSVYLDAVFYPNVLKDKRIFQQEGIRYELDSKDGELKYNGIVYNEMKGNYSMPDRILNKSIEQSLFPDTSYKFESGGLPEDMPTLTHEELVKTYNDNYHPSNSYFYLYGKMDVEKTLKFIGEKYLNNFDKKEVKTDLQLQKPFAQRVEKTVEYSIPKGAPTDNKTYLSLNYVIDKSTNKEMVEAFAFIQTLLGGIPSSPIKKALKDNGFGEDVSVIFDNSNIQPVLSIVAENVNENQKEKFKKVVDDTLQSIVEKGFDDELLNSISKVYDLSHRMLKGDFALSYNMLIMRSWLYGGDPTAYLNMNSDMADIKNKFEKGYMEDLVKKYLIDNKHSSLVVLKPVPGLEEKKESELKAKLANYKASLSKDKIDELVKNTGELKKWQAAPSIQEEINTLPTLTREDINKNVKEYKTIEKNENGVKVLQHPINTNGVDYVGLYFDTTKVSQDKLGYVYLLSQILGNIDTKNYSKEDLAEQMLINSGGIGFSTNCLVKYGDNDIYSPKMCVNLIGLNENIPKGFELLQEVIFNSSLNDKTRIKEIVNNIKMQKEQGLAYNGYGMAAERVASYMSESGKYKAYENEGFYSFLCDLDKNFDSKGDEIVKNLQQVRDAIFNKQDMIASITGNDENYKSFTDSLNKLTSSMKSDKLTSYKYTFDSSKINEGLIIPSKVQYVVKGGDLKKAGYTQNGKLIVLQNILQSDYLWNNIRVKGGAYGANIGIENGSVILSSYRDPNLKETIDTFDKIPEYLRNFKADEKQMNNYIIGAAGRVDNSTGMLNSLIGPAADGIIADGLYLTGVKQSDMQKEREELVSTTAEDIRNFAPVMDAVLKQNYLCVVGGETQIEQNKENFMVIKNVLTSKEEKGKFVELQKKDKVVDNKTWTVKFSDELDPLTVNTANIYVLDEENHQFKIKVSYDKNTKAIKVEPDTSYGKGKKYTLFIKDIKSVEKDGKSSNLIAPVKMDFTIN